MKNIKFRYFSSYSCRSFFPETMQLKSNYIPFLPVDVSISRLCVHLPHEQREEKAHLVREKMILKWLLRRTMRLRVAGDRKAKNRAKQSNIQFRKFLEWPFFSESCLGLSARTKMNEGKNMQWRNIGRAHWMYLVELVLGLFLFPCPFVQALKSVHRVRPTRKIFIKDSFPRSFAFQNCF